MVFDPLEDELPEDGMADGHSDVDSDVINIVDTSNEWITFRNQLASDMYNEWCERKGGLMFYHILSNGTIMHYVVNGLNLWATFVFCYNFLIQLIYNHMFVAKLMLCGMYVCK